MKVSFFSISSLCDKLLISLNILPVPGQTILNFSSFVIMLGMVQGAILTLIYFLQGTRKGLYSGLFFEANLLFVWDEIEIMLC
jgi:hypothetical protein